MNIIPVIIAGGRGTRLWPLSRDQLPKQFISLDGEASLLQNTISKLLDLGCKTPIIVCNLEHRFVVSAQIKKFDIEPRIILEPAGRDTAPAIALAAMISGSNDKLFIVSSDLMLPDKKDFSDAIQKGIDLSGNGKIVTFGVLPTSPHTGYGYIKCSDPLGSGFKIQKFQEKPNLKTAKQYLDSGEYFWNAGMFLFEAQDILNELQIHTPLVYKTCMEAIQKSSQDDSYIRIPEEIFSQCPSMSIDYAVMERTSNAIMIEMNGSWSDLGSWKHRNSHFLFLYRQKYHIQSSTPQPRRCTIGNQNSLLQLQQVDCSDTRTHRVAMAALCLVRHSIAQYWNLNLWKMSAFLPIPLLQ